MISYGSAYLQSMDCQRESQSKHPTDENPGIYTVGVPFLVLFWDRVPRDTTAAGHADMVMYCLELSRQYPEWEYRDSTMLAAASEQRWHVIDALMYTVDPSTVVQQFHRACGLLYSCVQVKMYNVQIT